MRVRGFTISPFVQLFRQTLIALKSRCDHYNDIVTAYVWAFQIVHSPASTPTLHNRMFLTASRRFIRHCANNWLGQMCHKGLWPHIWVMPHTDLFILPKMRLYVSISASFVRYVAPESHLTSSLLFWPISGNFHPSIFSLARVRHLEP